MTRSFVPNLNNLLFLLVCVTLLYKHESVTGRTTVSTTEFACPFMNRLAAPKKHLRSNTSLPGMSILATFLAQKRPWETAARLVDHTVRADLLWDLDLVEGQHKARCAFLYFTLPTFHLPRCNHPKLSQLLDHLLLTELSKIISVDSSFTVVFSFIEYFACKNLWVWESDLVLTRSFPSPAKTAFSTFPAPMIFLIQA